MGDPFEVIVDKITLGTIEFEGLVVDSKKSSGSLFIELKIKNETIIVAEAMPAPKTRDGP